MANDKFPQRFKEKKPDIIRISGYAVNQEDVEVVRVWKEFNFKRGMCVIK